MPALLSMKRHLESSLSITAFVKWFQVVGEDPVIKLIVKCLNDFPLRIKLTLRKVNGQGMNEQSHGLLRKDLFPTLISQRKQWNSEFIRSAQVADSNFKILLIALD